MIRDSTADRWYMIEAIALARRSVEEGAGGPFGALLVRDGRVLGRGRNRVVADCDPTAHAEVLAIREACVALGVFHLAGATLYASCEPCPMCLAAAHWAQLARVVYAAEAADAAALGFADGAIRDILAGRAEDRMMPRAQMMRAEALEVFRLWRQSPLRVPY
ncbi:MAG: nucleoside deaminase [Chromatiaceae bacterium]|jgi:tRNA(Arg) A34 adenosine deaminase TadA|nr:nucleoside deaminase [Chromatiaceae bacterium]